MVTSKNPVTTHTAREMAKSHADRKSGTLIDLGHGNWLATYTKSYEKNDDDEPLVVPVPPVTPNAAPAVGD